MNKKNQLLAFGAIGALSGTAYAGISSVPLPVGSPLTLMLLGVVGAVLVARFIKRR